ncbi:MULTISPECIES: hypothetical protein [unclassified Frankia]|uniref:hypothetical protein n=1 Tax=unclassified Frankia TaxID=2632575 RepID=UPI002024462C
MTRQRQKLLMVNIDMTTDVTGHTETATAGRRGLDYRWHYRPAARVARDRTRAAMASSIHMPASCRWRMGHDGTSLSRTVNAIQVPVLAAGHRDRPWDCPARRLRRTRRRRAPAGEATYLGARLAAHRLALGLGDQAGALGPSDFVASIHTAATQALAAYGRDGYAATGGPAGR